MKIYFFLLLLILLSVAVSHAQETPFQTGHTHDILEVRFSPDDSQLVSYSAGDGRIILWDVRSGRQLWTRKTSFIRKANERINLEEFYWSKNGAAVITKSENGTYQTWDERTGNILALADAEPKLEILKPIKKEVSYTKDYDSIKVVESDGGIKQFKRFGNNSAFDTSNNGEMFAEGAGWGDASIKITEIHTGVSWFLDGHPSVIGGIAFSPDGKFLAVGGSDKIIYIFDAQTHALVRKLLGHTKPINSLAFSPDGKTLISSGHNEILRVWDWQAGKFLQTANAEKDIFGVEKVAFSSDGKYFLTTSDRSEFRLWDAKTFKVVRDIKTADNYESNIGEMTIGYDAVPVKSAVFSRDGRKIISAHEDNSVRIWAVEDGKQFKKMLPCDKTASAAFINNQNDILLYCDKEDSEQIRIFDGVSGQQKARFAGDELGYLKAISVSPDGKSFLTSNISGDVLLWNENKPKPVQKFDIGFSGDDEVAFSPDGNTFAVGGRNQNLYLFDVRSGEKLWQLIPSYRPNALELALEEQGKKGLADVHTREAERTKQAEAYIKENRTKISASFSHYGDAESFWDQKIGESGEAKESKHKLPKGLATVAWFTLTNDSELPVSIDTNSMIFNPKCNGLCNGMEVSSRYVMELKNGDTRVNGFDMYSKTLLPPKTTVYFSVSLDHFAASKAIYLEFTFQKPSPDDKVSNDYGNEQKLYIDQSALPNQE